MSEVFANIVGVSFRNQRNRTGALCGWSLIIQRDPTNNEIIMIQSWSTRSMQ